MVKVQRATNKKRETDLLREHKKEQQQTIWHRRQGGRDYLYTYTEGD